MKPKYNTIMAMVNPPATRQRAAFKRF
ncbi:uncharacterized protein METZ01_LOCUS160048, partial [marine metagenome]